VPIPTAALPQRITIEAYQGTSGTGQPVYGPARTVRARVVGKRRAVRTREGVDVIADAMADVRPGATVPAESKVTVDSRVYEVLGIAESVELRRPHHAALILEGPKP
jgi:hypothetical protein